MKFRDVKTSSCGQHNAQNLFKALEESLEKHGFNFSNAVAFMSDTTNVMKGARSGVQKLIKREVPTLYDVGCIFAIWPTSPSKPVWKSFHLM